MRRAVGVPAPLKLHHNTSPTFNGFSREDGGGVDVGQKGLSRHHGDALIWRGSGALLSVGRGGWGLLWPHCLGE